MIAEKLTLRFDSQRLDYIATVLAQRPYAEVAPVLADIQQQIAEQQGPSPIGRGNGHAEAPAPLEH